MNTENILLEKEKALIPKLPTETPDSEDITYKPMTIDFPTGLYKTIMKTTEEDEDRYMKLVRKRYKRQMFRFVPHALLKALTVRDFNRVSDEEINRFYWICSLGKWLRWGNEKDVKKWSQYVRLDAEKMVIGNYEGMNDLNAYEGMYSMGGEAIFEHLGNKLSIKGIQLNGVFYLPTDGHAWECAKVFVMYGAYNHTLLVHHPRVHFQVNPVVGHSYRLLPKDHIIRKLLDQHFELSIEVNRAVLHSPLSAIGDNMSLPYTSFATERMETFRLISRGYDGIPGNDSYEPFEFQLEVPDYCTDYSKFLQAYYNVMLEFVEKVLKETNYKLDDQVRVWAKAVAADLPGFDANFIETNLAKVLAKIMHNASVEHSTEHGALAKLPVNKVFLRMRTPAPNSKEECSNINIKKMRTRIDYFKHLMTWRMYVNPNNIFYLKDIDYGFETSALKNLNKQFRQDLKMVEVNLRKQGVHIYDDFSNMAASIQY